MKTKMKNKKIENKVWAVDMRDDDLWQFVTITRKKDYKVVFCFSSGNVEVDGVGVKKMGP